MSPGGASAPSAAASICTRQLPHFPRPPHTDLMPAPAFQAAASNRSPERTWSAARIRVDGDQGHVSQGRGGGRSDRVPIVRCGSTGRGLAARRGDSPTLPRSRRCGCRTAATAPRCTGSSNGSPSSIARSTRCPLAMSAASAPHRRLGSEVAAQRLLQGEAAVEGMPDLVDQRRAVRDARTARVGPRDQVHPEACGHRDVLRVRVEDRAELRNRRRRPSGDLRAAPLEVHGREGRNPGRAPVGHPAQDVGGMMKKPCSIE